MTLPRHQLENHGNRSAASHLPAALVVVLFWYASVPTAVAQTWQQTAFPPQYGGSILALHVSPNGTIYAGTYKDGIVRSTDEGQTWKQVLVFKYPTYPKMASTSENVTFCSAGDGGGFYRTTDNGGSWLRVGPGDSTASIRGVAVNSLNQVFASEFDSVYRSSDSGRTWTPINNGLPTMFNPGQIVVSNAGTTSTLFLSGYDYAASLTKLFRSTDNGNSWIVVLSQSNIDNMLVHSNGYVFLRGSSGAMRSTDNGSLWQVIQRTPMMSMSNGDLWTTEDWLRILLRSTDNGVTWTVFDTVSTGGVDCLTCGPNGAVYMGTEGTGLFRTTNNGATWTQTNTGFPNSTTQVTTISGARGGFMIAGTAGFGSYVSTDYGDTWSRNDPGFLILNKTTRMVVHPSMKIFSAGSNALVAVSSDGGNHWWNPSQSVVAYDAAMDGSGNVYTCGTTSGVWRSVDTSRTWTQLPCPGTTYPRMHVTAQGVIVALTPYAGGSTQKPVTYYYTRISTDGGQTWNVSAPGGETNPVYEYASTRSGVLFAATELALYRSTDTGNSWQRTGLLSLGIGDIGSLAVNSSDIVFAGSSTRGILRSSDYGSTWEQFNTGLSDTVMCLSCDDNGYLFAGTRRKGIFKTMNVTTSADDAWNPLPVAFRLEQNYPNPFNPITEIGFQVSPARLMGNGSAGGDFGMVTLKVYDLLGREVATLVNQEQKAGVYAVTFDGGKLGSGVYLYRLTAGAKTEVKKMVLVK
jgi:hypothetical protein